MTIREAELSDIPGIVEVLKQSLGEDTLQVSEEVWRYKHVENPFGPSIVLLAIEDNQIVGVRAFMRWDWSSEEELYSCYRAVDTATHPSYRGKGIFSRLTKEAVEVAKQNGGKFIFNTPNEKSRPGYLKLGWKVVDKLRVSFQPSYTSFWKFGFEPVNVEIDYHTSDKSVDNLCRDWNSHLQKGNKLFTPKNLQYLTWRYENNPLQEYEVYVTSEFYLAACARRRNGLNELRIVENIGSAESLSSKEFRQVIRSWCSKHRTQLITFSGESVKIGKSSFSGKFGPVLTLRKLNVDSDENDHSSLENWNYSLGDLELF